MTAPAVSHVTAQPQISGLSSAPSEPDINFADVLSALNPLQYLPVVGTIYRAITGDRPPEAVRVIGSMIVGGLTGGPIGVAVSAVGALLQHMAGFDLDSLAHDALASMGLVDDAAAVAVASVDTSTPPAALPPSPAGSATAAEGPPVPDPARLPGALAAYGQTLYTYGPQLGHA